jgi:hypothetical protein
MNAMTMNAMNEQTQNILDAMPRAVRCEALRCWESGVRYLAWGVVWGANGPRTALIL